MTKTTDTGMATKLGGLIQPRGAATRPTDAPQRGEPETKAEKKGKGRRGEVRSPDDVYLSLRLTQAEYEAVRRFAFDRKMTHQEVLRSLVKQHVPEAA
jgi:hypothetical protein